jgi:hypothetical protein
VDHLNDGPPERIAIVKRNTSTEFYRMVWSRNSESGWDSAVETTHDLFQSRAEQTRAVFEVSSRQLDSLPFAINLESTSGVQLLKFNLTAGNRISFLCREPLVVF